jgi:hypothetical protein
MQNGIRAIALSSLFLIPICSLAQTSPAVPGKIWRAVENEISGDNSFDMIRYLTRYHAPNGSNDDFEAQANWVAEKAREYGLVDVKVFWVGGGRGRPWNLRSGEAWIVEPDVVKLGDTLESPLRIATNSRSADITAELIDVGEGTKESDFQDKDVQGKVVLASGPSRVVHALAVWKHGAAGVISYAPQRPYFPDQVALAFLPYKSDDGKEPTFAFLLTQREGDGLHGRLSQLKRDGKTMRVRVKIETDFNEARQGIAEGWIRGTNPRNDDIVLTAHMQEERTSANDDRSGVANLLEIARVLNKLIGEGKLERPQRNIRFWWVDEIGAEYRYLAENPEAARTMLANLNQDMVGAKQSEGFRVQFMSRTPFSRPSFLNDVVESVLCAVVWGNTAVPLRRGSNSSDFAKPMFALKGSREPYRAMPVPFYDSTDHMVFNDGRVGVPGISLTNWPDTYIHSTDDDLWQVDATQLKRNAFVIAVCSYMLASAGEADLARLTALVLGGAQSRLARDSAAAVSGLTDESEQDPANRYKDAVMLLDTAVWRESEAVGSLRVFADGGGTGGKLIATARERVQKLAFTLRADLDVFYQQLTGRKAEVVLTEEEKQAAVRIPSWKATLLDTQTEKVKMPDSPENLHWHYVFEINNLIDGKRSILFIYRMARAAALSAGKWYYGSVEFSDVTKYFESLEKEGVIAIQGK